MQKVLIELVREGAKIPYYSTTKAAGCDLYAPESATIPPRGKILMKLGFKTVIPEGYYFRIESRSGLSVKFSVEKGAGIIDEDYRDEWGAVLYNHSDYPFHVIQGDRIAQAILHQYEQAEFEIASDDIEQDEESNRRGGFGHTGVSETPTTRGRKKSG